MAPPTTLLRSALEAAVQVARAGETADPAHPAPPALRRYLRFARLPAPALDIARRVLDEDDSFRQRVADALSEDDVGEAGWLWLTRPEGWERRLDDLKREAQQREHQDKEDRAERDAQRRLVGAEERARRAEATLAARTGELAEARASLHEERAARALLASELATATEQGGELLVQRNNAVRKLKEIEAVLAERTADLRQARHEIRMREAELAQTKSTVAKLATTPMGQTTSSKSTPTSPTIAAPPAAPAPAPAPAPAAGAELTHGAERQQLARLIADAAAAAEQLSAAFTQASALLDLTDAPLPPKVPARDRSASAAPAGPRPLERQPSRLPPGVLDDSTEAADHLVRIAGALLLVDGYNISQAAWPSLPIAEQRTRLVDALEELHARTGIDIEVVFDGAEPAGPSGRGSRSAVRVRFSPATVEADDVVLELCAAAPAGRPVVVASSDRRVRNGARRQGANLLSARQLLAALRR